MIKFIRLFINWLFGMRGAPLILPPDPPPVELKLAPVLALSPYSICIIVPDFPETLPTPPQGELSA